MRSVGSEVFDIRMDEAALSALLDELDAQVAELKPDARKSERHPLRGLCAIVALDEVDYTPVCYRVRLRNVSLHGICLVGGRAMLPGTRIRITLPITVDDHNVVKYGRVCRCRHIRGMIFEVGVEFCAEAEAAKPQEGQSESGCPCGPGSP